MVVLGPGTLALILSGMCCLTCFPQKSRHSSEASRTNRFWMILLQSSFWILEICPIHNIWCHGRWIFLLLDDYLTSAQTVPLWIPLATVLCGPGALNEW